MAKQERTVGQTVECYCGKCKVECAHTIAVMDEEAITKVKCSTCGASHQMRNAPEPGTGRKSKSGTIDGGLALPNWETCIAEATGKGHTYNASAKYRVGDIVDHFAFGKGVVVRLRPNRCDMLFKDKSRLMVSAN